MPLPNYKDGSIVNLMGSIGAGLRGKPKYGPLRILPPSELISSKNIVLVVIDGLGYNYLRKAHGSSFLRKHLRGSITSVFPSTTACCVTTFATGLAPQQHGITGWFMHLKELGVVSAILRFIPRTGGIPFSQLKVDPKSIFDSPLFVDSIRADSYVIAAKDIIKTDYTIATSKSAKRLHYIDQRDFFKQIRNVVKKRGKRKFVYAYWPDFDHICHEHGLYSRQAERHLKVLDRDLAALYASLASTDTTVIITADHGMIDIKKRHVIKLEDHPIIQQALTLPLCGEPRAAYCYVHPSKAKAFERYVRTRWKGKCMLLKSEDAIRRGYFGLFKPNKNLFDRVGDYVLVMKDRFVITDRLLSEDERSFIGHHGGVHADEMLVPLIIVKSRPISPSGSR